MADGVGMAARAFGGPKREGSIDLGRPMVVGEVGVGMPTALGSRLGDAARGARAGEEGRASFDGPANEGLPARVAVIARADTAAAAGDPGRCIPLGLANLDT